MKKPLGIALMVAAAAVLGWLLISRRQKSAVAGAQAALSESPGELQPVFGLQGFTGQIGSNVKEDVTADVVERALDFAQKQIDRVLCWRPTFTDYDGANAGAQIWTHTDGRTAGVPVGGVPPAPRCDGF